MLLISIIKMNKTKIFKILAFIVFILLIIFITIKVFPIFKNIFTLEGRIEFQNKIQNLGIKGVFVILALIFIQIFLLFLPIEPVELLAGMCYGTWGGLAVIYLGAIIATTIVYFLVRFFGRQFIYGIVSKEKIEKLESSEFWKNSKKIDVALFIAYFIPGTPKGLLTYIGALLPISFPKFLAIILIARFPEIISSTLVGNSILYGNWIVIILSYVITFVISAFIFFVYSKIIDKKNLNTINN